ncbi:MAG TPA: ChaN family lipoprotein [Candidatus Eisenbacteria bacterium]
MTTELKRYRGAYEADFRGAWRACGVSELEEALAGADMVLSGDYHTLPASQRLLIRLLRRLLPRDDRPATLALEMLHSEDQPVVDRYLAGRMGLEALREAISFDHRWGFDWRHYGALLRFARERKLMVLGINVEPGVARGRLLKRDEHAARILVDHWQAAPERRIHLLAGDWHVARAHLPRLIRAEAKARGLRPSLLVIHQNHERLHARLDRPAGAPAVARRGRDLFCVLNTTPLVKADSNRLWASRQESSDDARARFESGEWPLFDPTLAFREVDEVVARHLKLGPAPPFELVGPDDVPGLERTARRCDAPAGRATEWRKRLADGKVVWVPKARTLLLGHAPIHRLAEEAMRRRLEAPTSPWQLRLVRLDRDGTGASSSGVEARFHRRLRIEGAAFLASKLVNPDRKCRLFADWNRTEGGLAGAWVRAWIRAARRQPGRLPFTAPDHPFWTIRAATRLNVARAVGKAWGWHFFQAWTAGSLPWESVTALVDPIVDEGHDRRVISAGVSAFPDDVDRHSKETLL